jgi:hypothetical protein
MEPQWGGSHTSPRFLVYHGHDCIVRPNPQVLDESSRELFFSIALPWCFVREVPVDIELVSDALFFDLGIPKIIC